MTHKHLDPVEPEDVEIDVPDSASEEDIEKAVRDFVMDYFEYGYDYSSIDMRPLTRGNLTFKWNNDCVELYIANKAKISDCLSEDGTLEFYVYKSTMNNYINHISTMFKDFDPDDNPDYLSEYIRYFFNGAAYNELNIEYHKVPGSFKITIDFPDSFSVEKDKPVFILGKASAKLLASKAYALMQEGRD